MNAAEILPDGISAYWLRAEIACMYPHLCFRPIAELVVNSRVTAANGQLRYRQCGCMLSFAFEWNGVNPIDHNVHYWPAADF